jgi:glycosyltransferase involved in cell wall biosynthesis
VASLADRDFVISEQLGRYACERWGIQAGRLHLLPNCVDADRIKPDPATPVIPRGIGYAGSLLSSEGLDTLIEAVSLLIRKGRAVRLHIMGDGEAGPALEAQVAALGLGDYVRFFGKMPPEDARAHLGRCALVCIPRRDFVVCRIVPPLKLAEALALGKAVVVPDLPVFRDEMGPDPAGWFFRAGDAEHLATVLDQALADPERLAATGSRGRRHVLRSRQWRQFTDSILFLGRNAA